MRENTLTSADLIWPIFVIEGANLREPVASMPMVERLSIDGVVDAAREAIELGISGRSRCFPISTQLCAMKLAARRSTPII